MVLGVTMPAGLGGLVTGDLSWLQQLAEMLKPFRLSTALFIYFKNVSSLVFGFVFSPFLLLPPVLSLVVNGWLLSYVSTAVIQQRSLWLLLAGILPHGIFEIPAIVLGEAAALSFGTAVLMALVSPAKRDKLFPKLKMSAKYLLVAFALLVPAAIIETYITPLLVRL
jgi:stage II sporulation protein M